MQQPQTVLQMFPGEVVEAARAGDEQARDALLLYCLAEVHRSVVRRYASVACQEVDDLMQDVALELWRCWSTVLAARRPVAMAVCIAKCRLARHCRRQIRRDRRVRFVSLDAPLASGCDGSSLLDVLPYSVVLSSAEEGGAAL
jgi:DNA-directed RNA polymerase specialized sigma24 family protein